MNNITSIIARFLPLSGFALLKDDNTIFDIDIVARKVQLLFFQVPQWEKDHILLNGRKTTE